MADSITDDDVIDAMQTYGGSFVQSIARALRAADAENRARLKAAFPDLWTQYAEAVVLIRQRVGRR